MENLILESILRERAYQKYKHKKDYKSLAAYLILIRAELDEAEEGWIKVSDEKCLEELLQVMTLCYACIEQHGIVERPEKEHLK